MLLEKLENLLFRIGFTIAGRNCVKKEDLEWIESVEKALAERTIEVLDGFRLNGSTVPAASIALARTAVRRAERAFWACMKHSSVKPTSNIEDIGGLLNRLSDLLYLMQLEADRIKGREPPKVKC